MKNNEIGLPTNMQDEQVVQSTNSNLKEVIYNTDFYEDHAEAAEVAANIVLPIVASLFTPLSVVDIGCGAGEWLKAAERVFDSTTLGLDGHWNRVIAGTGIDFKYEDFEQGLKIDTKFDLAICLEVIEHLTPAAGNNLVQKLTEVSDVILFSAAIEDQPGANHLNCQWQSYWVQQFESRSYVVYDCIRPRIWNNEEIPWWYKQNMLLFVKKDSDLHTREVAKKLEKHKILDLVHPQYYNETIYWRDRDYDSLRNRLAKLEESFANPTDLRFVLRIMKRYLKSKLH